LQAAIKPARPQCARAEYTQIARFFENIPQMSGRLEEFLLDNKIAIRGGYKYCSSSLLQEVLGVSGREVMDVATESSSLASKSAKAFRTLLPDF
jgi:hypothetical protein